jgi:hypothetical protein
MANTPPMMSTDTISTTADSRNNHVDTPITKASRQSVGSTSTSTSSSSSSSIQKMEQQQQHHQQHHRAISSQANAVVDAVYRPSTLIFNSDDPSLLLSTIDGPSLEDYDAKESIYVGRSIPIVAGASLNVPIHISHPGSIVEYVVEIKSYGTCLSIYI